MRNLAFLLALTSWGCGSDETKKTPAAAPAGTASGSGSKPASADAVPVADPKAAKTLWTNVILPAFNKQCASCHAEPRFTVPQRGPLTIFIYDNMRKMLVDGPTSARNALIDRLTGAGHHDGGKRCELTVAPCADIVKWRQLELGADADAGAETADGGGGGTEGGSPDERPAALSKITSAGKIYGWAVNKADAAKTVSVKIYLDGDKAGGTLAATTPADKAGDDGNNAGSHAFFVQIPAAFLDGKDHEMYFYGDGDEPLTPVGPDALKFKAWGKTMDGENYFNAKIAGMITSSCDGCHPSSYDFFHGILLEKGPNEGGTAVNNALINKPATANGTSHSGGNRCGGVSGGVCAEFQKWWDVEFAPR